MYGFNAGNRVNSVVFSADGTLMATGNGDGTVRLWDLATLEETAVLPADSEQYVYAISSNNRYLWSGVNGCDTWLWDVETPAQPVMTWGCNQNVRFLPDEIRVIDVKQEVTVSVASAVTDLSDFVVQSRFNLTDVIDQGYIEYSVNPDGTLLALLLGTNAHSRVLMVALSTGKVLYTLAAQDITHVIFSSDSQLAALSHSDNTITLWNLTSQTKLHELIQSKDHLHQVIFSPENTLFIARTYGGVEAQQFWDVETGELRRLENLQYINDMDFSPDGTLIAVADYQGVRLWGIAP